MSDVQVDNGKLRLNGFTGTAEYDDEADRYFGILEHGRHKVTYQAKTFDSLKQSFRDAVNMFRRV